MLKNQVDNANNTEREHLLLSLNDSKIQKTIQKLIDYKTRGLLLRCQVQHYVKVKNTKYLILNYISQHVRSSR